MSVLDRARPALRTEELHATTERMAQCILAHCDFGRTDRLAPSHPTVYATNPMSFAYGAGGIAMFLHRELGGLPERVEEWLLKQPLGIDGYPPSLFLGLPGIAMSLWEVGLTERAEEAMRLTYDSPLLYAEPGLYVGTAGWGWASLYFWQRTRDDVYLQRAVDAGEHLLKRAEHDGDTVFWRHPADDDRIHYGYGFGSAGVGLYLLNLGLHTGNGAFLDAARKALDYDLAHPLRSVNGITWRRFEDDVLNYPYFLHGSAGIGSVVVRFARTLGDERYWSMAREIAASVYLKWTVFPGMLHGMAGIAEFALDMHGFTDEDGYLAQAMDQVETMLWFRISTPEGVAFPGVGLLKICHEWATGTAGVGGFLHRLRNPGPRFLVDLPEPALLRRGL